MVLEEAGFNMELIDFIYVDKDPEALNFVKQIMGFQGVPVIDAPGFEAFKGFRPDVLKKIVASF